MDAPAAPAAPDPVATANAQSASNIATATNQQYLNMVDQYTPWGSLTYTQDGTWGGTGGGSTSGGGAAPKSFSDAMGLATEGYGAGGRSLVDSTLTGQSPGGYTGAGGVPHFSSHVNLSPEQQKLFDLQNQTQANLGQIGVSQSAKIGKLLDTPFSVDSATADKIQGIQNEFLDPQWARQQEAQRTELFNAGVRPGSEAYDAAMRDFSTNRQRAYDQSYLDSYNTGQQAALTERNQPLNEITALLSGSQVNQPSFGATPTAGVAPTDVIGAQGQALAQQNVGYQGQLARAMGINSGLFSLGSAAIGGGSRIAAGGLGK